MHSADTMVRIFMHVKVNSSLVMCAGAGGVYFNDQMYQNNSMINLLDIGSSTGSIPVENTPACLTNLFPCCGAAKDNRNWYSPDGSVLTVGSTTGSFYQTYNSYQTVVLHRSETTPLSEQGLFRCQITNTESVYIGIYSDDTGKYFKYCVSVTTLN